MSPSWYSDLIPYDRFIGDGIARLRSGGTIVGFEVGGPSPEMASDAELEAGAERLTGGIRHLGTGDMVHMIVHRQPMLEYPTREFASAAGAMIDEERRQQFLDSNYFVNRARVYLANQDDFPAGSYLKGLLFSSTAERAVESQELQRKRFLHRIQGWYDAVAATLRPAQMSSAKMFRDLILCATGRDYPAIEPAAHVPLNQIIAQHDLIGGNEPAIGELYLRPLSITTYPSETVPQMLAVLLRQPGQLMLSVRYICLDPIDAQEQLQLERAHWVRESQGGLLDIIAKILNMPRRATHNQHVEAQIADVDDAIAAANGGTPFGFLTVTCTLMGDDPEVLSSRWREARKDLNAIGVGARMEDANAAAAVLGTLPGNGVDNVRRPLAAGSTFSELALPVDNWAGTPIIDSSFFAKGTPVPLLCTGTGHSPFAVPSHYQGVGHQLLLGGTGGGKSTLMGVLVAATTALSNVRIVWLDRERSSFVLTHALGGTYIELATDNSSPLCPFRFLDLPHGKGVAFLFDWFTRLFARWHIQLDERQAAELTEALEIAKATGLRAMSLFIHLIQEPRMRGVLMNYGAGGKWSHIFDGEPANHDNTLITYEMRELDALGDRAAAPAMELIIYGVEVGLDGQHPTFLFADESWRLLNDQVSQDWLYQGLRTWRKRNGSIILATQSLVELASSGYRELLLESCPGKIWTPNAEIKGEVVRNAYRSLGLTETELDVIATAIPQREYFWTSPAGRRLFNLDLGPIARALCASTGSPEVAAAREILARVGQNEFLDEWLHNRLAPNETKGGKNGNDTSYPRQMHEPRESRGLYK